MDKLEKREEELYARAYNHGYYLQQFKPEMANAISETPHAHNIYLQTFNDGREAFLEEMKEKLKEHQTFPTDHANDNNRDHGMDIDR